MKPIVFLLVAFVLQFSNFTRAASGTFLIKPSDLRLTNIRILAERPMGDRTEIEFTTDIQNLDSGRFADVTVFVVTSNAAPSLIVTDSMLQFASLAPMATVSDDANSLIITVANLDVTSTRAQILNGSILDYNAMEEL